MKVILKQKVSSLGKAGDLIKVNDGYARNYLIPKGLAIEADEKNIKLLEHEKKNILNKTQKKIQKCARFSSRPKQRNSDFFAQSRRSGKNIRLRNHKRH